LYVDFYRNTEHTTQGGVTANLAGEDYSYYNPSFYFIKNDIINNKIEKSEIKLD
jgi:hypothetical protein